MLRLLAALLGLALLSQGARGLPAFPGAEGGGAKSLGGRGGAILQVTHLGDEGPGSFRAACEASGPRIVVFRTGGTITLRRPIDIRNPYITIAGQTAPGGGILLKTARGECDAIVVYTHDVVIRFLRVRNAHDGFGAKGASRLVIDHCSVSWCRDENMSDNVYNVNDVGGFPAIAAGTPYIDTDGDGMPDAWEKARGLDPTVNDSAGDRDGDGYTNIEEFLNSPLRGIAARAVGNGTERRN
jgi:hypothetical protein